MEERVTYGEIRAWFLGSYYNYCRVKLNHQSPWVEGVPSDEAAELRDDLRVLGLY